MRQIVSESLWQLVLYRWLIGAFAALAVTLAAIGLYAMIAYTAASRLQEFAIRRALGSDPWHIVRLIFNRGLGLCVLGLVAGIVSLLVATWWLGDWIPGLRADVVTCVLVSLFFLGVTTIACVGPARRAATANPIVALRNS
jgi:ABC-type lipoprotein release transport system permease subunit